MKNRILQKRCHTITGVCTVFKVNGSLEHKMQAKVTELQCALEESVDDR